MKRIVLFSILMLSLAATRAQLNEDFTPTPTGWILSNGASFGNVTGNDLVLTPGVGGNNPAVIGTPAVNKTSNTVKVCLDIWAYTANLNTQINFPCATYMDVLFVKSTVNSANDAQDPANIIARVDNHPLPIAGGNTCFTFNFPAAVTDTDFKVFLSFHAGCGQSNTKYVVDNISISGVDEVCTTNDCLPSALDDNFVRPNPFELSFNGILYGSNLSYPTPPAGYESDATGTDNDPNDSYSHLKWSLVTPPANGNVVINDDGTMTITRNNLNITQVTFTYRMCDDGADNNFGTTGDNSCATATVTANLAVGSAMPVSLINYFATRNASQVSLKWTTTYESNNKGFEIQRSIGSGNYETIAFVGTKAKDGNSGVSINYDFRDNNNSNQTSMYRLVQIDNDGTRKFHGIKVVAGLSGSAKLLVYPNPSPNGQVTVGLGSVSEKDIAVVNLQGRTIKAWNSFKSDNLVITDLKPGMYMVQVFDKISGEKRSEKILVIH